MIIYELDLHYVLCRPYVFVLMLTNTTDDDGKCYLHLQFQVKKYQPSLFQYICFNHIVEVFFKTTFIVNLNAILHTVHKLFVRASYLKKMYHYVFMSEKCRTLYISITKISRMFD